MASVNVSGKRRRLDYAASTLSKPFKSPLRKPVSASGNKEEVTIKEENNADSSNTAMGQNVAEEDTKQNLVPATPISSGPVTGNLKSTSPMTNLQTRKRKTHDTQTPTKKAIFTDPITFDLQKQQRALQSRLSALRSELNTVEQALRIESSTKDVELEDLITKWRCVSQNAAEEVFAGAQERVSRMGGMAVWRDRMNRNNSRWDQDEMQSWYGNERAASGEVDEDELESRKVELLDQLDVRQESEEIKDEGSEDEDFTMDMMLKTLNIDLNIIGYDKSGQRWVKN
ncbi:hypothetical protein MW887_009582 [Aspergillus wentii]|nr:hypothetical protein MW887_009582 [Aspergillus wentii]